MKATARGLVLIVLLLLNFPLGVVQADEDRSYRISDVEIRAVIDRAGNLHVKEKDTYHFSGSFEGILVELDTMGSSGISLFEAYENRDGQLIPLDVASEASGNREQYRVYSASEDESKTFEIAYTILDAVTVHTDTAELYWKFFDVLNETKLENVNIDISLEQAVTKADIRAFGHGPEDGNVSISPDGTVTLEIRSLPAGRMLEARMLFPVSAVPDSTKLSGEPKFEEIMEQERLWAEDGIYPGNDEYVSELTVKDQILLFVFNIGLGALLWFFFRKIPAEAYQGKYYRDLPEELTPAVVGYLMRHKVVASDLIATLMDLVRRKQLTLSQSVNKKGKPDFVFSWDGNQQDDLKAHEQYLLDWLFTTTDESNNQLTLSKFQDYTKNGDNAKQYYEHWQAWQQQVKEVIDQRGYFKSQVWLVLLLYLLIGFQMWMIISELLFWPLLAPLLLLVLKPRSYRRTLKGNVAYAKWLGFKNFLRDYSRMDTREPMHVHLWSHYFVYAIPLGQAKAMLKTMPIQQAGMENDYDANYYTFMYHYNDWSKTVSLANNVSTINESGDGGSFSSGGGGGGGGGGRGAF